MRVTDDDPFFPKPPYKGGRYLISLRAPFYWYVKLVKPKGKTLGTVNIATIMSLLVDKTFGIEIDQEEIDLALNLDCLVAAEAAYVQKELEERILGEILSRFPRIGAEIPAELFSYTNMDLTLYVPKTYEEQRSLFF